MAKLTGEMKALIEEVRLCYVATADNKGIPNVSVKGSIQVLDDEHLLFADIFSEKTRKNLQENNKICIYVVAPQKMVGFQFKGEAQLINSGTVYEQVCEAVANMNLNLPKPAYAVITRIEEIFPAPAAK